VGDWVRCGNANFGERYVDAARLTGYDIQSLRNMAHVASRFDPVRRRRALSYSHHAALARMAPDPQDYWLDRAEADRLSVSDLRLEVKAAERREADSDPQAAPDDSATAVGAPTSQLPSDAVNPVKITCPACGNRLNVHTDVGMPQGMCIAASGLQAGNVTVAVA
jgi:hypothetical protein